MKKTTDSGKYFKQLPKDEKVTGPQQGNGVEAALGVSDASKGSSTKLPTVGQPKKKDSYQ